MLMAWRRACRRHIEPWRNLRPLACSNKRRPPSPAPPRPSPERGLEEIDALLAEKAGQQTLRVELLKKLDACEEAKEAALAAEERRLANPDVQKQLAYRDKVRGSVRGIVGLLFESFAAQAASVESGGKI